MTIKCAGCGKFVSNAEIESGEAMHIFEPSSHLGPEISDWLCATCAQFDAKSWADAAAIFAKQSQ